MARLFSELLDTITIIISISYESLPCNSSKGNFPEWDPCIGVTISLSQGVSDDFFSC